MCICVFEQMFWRGCLFWYSHGHISECKRVLECGYKCVLECECARMSVRTESEASDTVLALPPSPMVGLLPSTTIVSLHHQRHLFFSPGERGAKGDPGAPGVGLRGEMGPPGIPGRSGSAGVWGRGGGSPQGVGRKGKPLPARCPRGPFSSLQAERPDSGLFPLSLWHPQLTSE